MCPMEGVRNHAGTRGGSHPVTSLQKFKIFFGLFQGWAALRLWIWSTGVLHAGTQSCCPCLSHSALPTHPVYVYPSPRSTLSTMNATGSHLHLKSWPSPASPHSQERFLYPRHFGFNCVCINCINYTGNTLLELLQSFSPSTVNSI